MNDPLRRGRWGYAFRSRWRCATLSVSTTRTEDTLNHDRLATPNGARGCGVILKLTRLDTRDDPVRSGNYFNAELVAAIGSGVYRRHLVFPSRFSLAWLSGIQSRQLRFLGSRVGRFGPSRAVLTFGSRLG